MAESKTARVFRTNPESKASIYLQDEAVSIIGDQRHFVTADNRGVTIKGPVSIIADATGIRTGGLFVGLNDFLQMIPSTMWTPIPKHVPFPPVFALTNIARDVAFFISLLI